MEKICVAVRVRPAVNEEKTNGSFWKVEDNRISLYRSLGTPVSSGISYAFDHVFDEECTNSRVYELLTKDIIHAAIDGFNGTAFAYGQTSSGKTFTMNGSDNDPGIIHRAVEDVFRKIQITTDREFLIRVSYMEIYNEEINDLFSVENQKLQIHESLERGIFVAGLREEIVNSADQVLKLIKLGEVNRHFGETNMNVRSSRSHTIFRMVIESKGKDTSSTDYSTFDDAIRVSVLNLVDLAGSERIAKTGAGGVRLKEGKHINKSLMILGNVINKLSDGARQRGHIPYRDSKLTRILQPALGGNAKTSIICTVAPEEVHIEETKGTLQFASRAKRITNCVQVNEILTDAALLKRQKLEIEELRMKLQGSHAGVLEQEILNLRNDMLKFELEREKLAMELEEERKSHRERDQCLKEQQMKFDNLNGLDTFSDSNRNSSLGQEFVRHHLTEESNSNHCTEQGDAFSTPCFKPPPHAFVVRRGHRSKTPEYSPLPDAFSDIADEETWQKMNKGFIADLDSLRLTPARKVQSYPSIDETHDCSTENCKQEVEDLRRQLKLALEEKSVLEKQHKEQIQLNNRLMEEVSELQQEALLIREIPQRLSESVANCKEIYRDVFSIIQSFVADEKSSTAQLLSTTREIGTYLMSTLESHFSKGMDGSRRCSENDFPIQENCNTFCEGLISSITYLVLNEAQSFNNLHSRSLPHCSEYKEFTLGGQSACWRERLGNEVNMIKEKYLSLEKELDSSNRLLEASKERYHSLEKEFYQLLEERDALALTLSSSSKSLALMTEQKEKVLQDLSTEIQRRKDLEDEIKQFSVAFASRQKSLVSFHSEFKSKIEILKAQKPVSSPKSLGY